MKNISNSAIKKISIALLATCIVTPALAIPTETSRFSGELFLNIGYLSTNSNLNTNTNAAIQHLSEADTNENGEFIAPLGSLTYSLDKKNTHRLYVGTSRDDIAVGTLAFELGYQYDLRSGTTVDISYLPTVMSGEVWSNPYLVGEERIATDTTGNASRLKLMNLAGTQVSLDMAYATAEVEDDAITEQALLRDSKSYYLRGQYLNMFDMRSGLISSFGYADHSAQGKAASFKSYEVELTYVVKTANYNTALTTSYNYRPFEALNPIFNKVRSDDEIKLFIAYEYTNIEGWDDWAFTSFAGYTLNSSNIDFYNNNEALLSVGINYKF